MIYYLIRPIVRFATKLYFRNIYIDGLENIPQDKPVILASNHPSAFIEPCLLACYLPVDLHFLVRGDLFSKRWLSWLLKGTNQIPIFRQRDGLDNVKKNLMTQDALRSLFNEKKAVLMFPEAHTHENLFIRPLKKGLARFAFMDEEADVYVVPVGVNFDKNIPFSSKVSIKVGEAVSVRRFRENNTGTEAHMYKAFLNNMYERMKLCVRHIENEDREEVIHQIFCEKDNIERRPVFPVVSMTDDVFQQEKDIATILDADNEKYNEIRNVLSRVGISKNTVPKLWELIMMILFLPLFLVGYIIHFIPITFTKSFIKKRIKVHEFKSPVFLGLIIFIYLSFTMLSLLFGLLFNLKILGLYMITCLLGILSVFYYKAFHRQWTYVLSNSSKKGQVDELIQNFTS